jgi:leucyl/phenylalanyl-tRNA--protein transferase
MTRRALSTDVLLRAYESGFFPMADSVDGRIEWFSPDPRAIIPLDGLRVSRSLRRVLRRRPFAIASDVDFDAVIRACAARPETWISGEIVEAYGRLFRLGIAHTVEVRERGRLVGGLYGVARGGAFFGESMFSAADDASKVALVDLVRRLRAGGFTLLDTQFMTDHLRSLGAVDVGREEYLGLLEDALQVAARWDGGEVTAGPDERSAV